jgi:hypothetical protein
MATAVITDIIRFPILLPPQIFFSLSYLPWLLFAMDFCVEKNAFCGLFIFPMLI